MPGRSLAASSKRLWDVIIIIIIIIIIITLCLQMQRNGAAS